MNPRTLRWSLPAIVLTVAALYVNCRPSPPAPQPTATISSTATAETWPATRLLSAEERVDTFEDMWNVLKRDYLYFDRRDVDWEAVRAKYLPLAREASDDEAFADVLRMALAEVHDGHVLLIPDPDNYLRPAIWTEPDGEQIAISGVDPDSDAERQGLKPGMVLLAVDGLPATAAWERSVAKTSATMPAQRRWLGAQQLLFGRSGSTVTITAAFPGGHPVSATLLRKAKTRSPLKSFEKKLLPGGIMYVRIGNMNNQAVMLDARAAFCEAGRDKAAGLIIDVRYNPGGLYHYGFFDCLAQKLSVAAISRENRTGELTNRWVAPLHDAYTGPVVVLTNPGCASACDIFVSIMVGLDRGVLVGAPPGGTAIYTRHHAILHGFKIAYPYEEEWLGPDGNEIEGHPAPVKHLVVPTAADWAAGRDPVLEKAIELLASR